MFFQQQNSCQRQFLMFFEMQPLETTIFQKISTIAIFGANDDR